MGGQEPARLPNRRDQEYPRRERPVSPTAHGLGCAETFTQAPFMLDRSRYQTFLSPSHVAPMKMRWLFVVVLIGLLLVLTPMAFASSPDPSWIGGFWDDADFDDVILHLTGCCPAVSSETTTLDATAVATVVGFVLDSPEDPLPDRSSFSHGTRAPPAS